MKIIILGKQGSGKGTQGKLVARNYQIPHIATGDLFRQIAKEDSELGNKVRSLMMQGDLIPDDVVIEVVLNSLKNKDDFVLDGYPRNYEQAEKLFQEIKVDAVILLDISDDEAIRRLSARRNCPQCGEIYNVITKPPVEEGKCDKCGYELFQREDDKADAIKKRLATYKEMTEPLFEFYKEKNLLRKVDGQKDMEEIFSDIKEILDPLKEKADKVETTK